MGPKRLKCPAATVIALLFVSCATVDQRPGVVIDGSFDDWASTAPALNDATDDAPVGFVDFGSVKIRHDRDAVYFLVNVGRIVTAQRLPGTVSLLLDVDGDANTGTSEHGLDGVDIVLEFPLPNERMPGTPGAGIRLRALSNGGRTSEPLNAYSVGFLLAPVHAGNVFEARIDRRGAIGPTPPLFQGERFHGKFVAMDLDNKHVDSTEVFSHALTRTTASRTPTADPSIDPLRRITGTDFRILFWNVSRGAHIRNPEPFARILGAVRPDIVVFDEVPPTTNAEEIARFLQEAFIMDSWNVSFGKGGNDQRTIIASQMPVETAEPFRSVPWADNAVDVLVAMSPGPDAEVKAREWLGETVPTNGALVDTADGRLLVAGFDFQCCGGYETIQDRRRILEAEAVNGALRRTVASTKVDGVIAGGDLNLVGDPAVASIMSSEAAPDGSDLQLARALQLDGLSDATWASPDEPFVPGRLDVVAYSKGSLAVKRAFVFDSSDINQRWQAYYGVRAGDNPDASDHFPIVVDFQWVSGRSK